MRRRSGMILSELNRRIARMEWRMQNRQFGAGFRQTAYLQLVWLEAQRERLLGIAEPARRRP